MVSTISAAWKRHALAVELVGAAAAAVHGDIDAVVLEDALELLDVGEARHVFEHQRILGQERGDHQRQGGVLGARDGDFAPQLVAADQTNAIHIEFPMRRPMPPLAFASRAATRFKQAQNVRSQAPSPSLPRRRRRRLATRIATPASRPRLPLAALEVLPKLCGQSLLARLGLVGLGHIRPPPAGAGRRPAAHGNRAACP